MEHSSPMWSFSYFEYEKIQMIEIRDFQDSSRFFRGDVSGGSCNRFSITCLYLDYL